MNDLVNLTDSNVNTNQRNALNWLHMVLLEPEMNVVPAQPHEVVHVAPFVSSQLLASNGQGVTIDAQNSWAIAHMGTPRGTLTLARIVPLQWPEPTLHTTESRTATGFIQDVNWAPAGARFDPIMIVPNLNRWITGTLDDFSVLWRTIFYELMTFDKMRAEGKLYNTASERNFKCAVAMTSILRANRVPEAALNWFNGHTQLAICMPQLYALEVESASL